MTQIYEEKELPENMRGKMISYKINQHGQTTLYLNLNESIALKNILSTYSFEMLKQICNNEKEANSFSELRNILPGEKS
ncbi:hypothetical protein COB55_03045 [Candidatus Wolfebacteria bacterium]|nr:MAG: hypothetical protein COB55_03045 [Candidatus Wolfebacteria bacterium]